MNDRQLDKHLDRAAKVEAKLVALLTPKELAARDLVLNETIRTSWDHYARLLHNGQLDSNTADQIATLILELQHKSSVTAKALRAVD